MKRGDGKGRNGGQWGEGVKEIKESQSGVIS